MKQMDLGWGGLMACSPDCIMLKDILRERHNNISTDLVLEISMLLQKLSWDGIDVSEAIRSKVDTAVPPRHYDDDVCWIGNLQIYQLMDNNNNKLNFTSDTDNCKH